MSQLRVDLVRSGETGSTADIRGHALTFDRPDANGGNNTGPMGGEAFLAAIGGCFMSTLIATAAAREVKIPDVACAVVGTFADNPRRFESVNVTASSSTCEPEEFAHLVLLAGRGCLVLNTLRHMTATAVSVEAGSNG